MTEELEQKAEEYSQKLAENGFSCGTCFGKCEYAYEKNDSGIVKIPDFFEYIKQAYKDGYEQGQNIQRKVFAENCSRCSKKRIEISKENEELKEKLNTLRNYFTANIPDGEKVFNLLCELE